MSRPKHKKRSKKRKRSKHHRQQAGQKRRAKQQQRAKRKGNRPRPGGGPASYSCACPSHAPPLPAPMRAEQAPVQAERGVATWVPPGGRIVVQGRSIKGGMVYVGSDAASASGYWTEPSLIDPDLAVDWRRVDWDGTTLDDWPSYHQIGPRARAGYLAWLAGGRSDESAHIGYVFLFLYGLERRLLVDIGQDPDHPDIPAVTTELMRLMMIYGADRSFLRSAGNLLALIDALKCAHDDIEPVPWDLDRLATDNPVAVLIGIGKQVGDGSRIPAEWALSYLGHHPETRLRTAAERCPDEFGDLFLARYRARYSGGIEARRPARSIRLLYQTASHGFEGMMVFPSSPDLPVLAEGFELGSGGEVSITFDSIPDVTTTPSLIRALWRLAAECTDELDAYSRFIGRNPGAARTAGAAALLPDVLLASHGGPIIDDLRGWTSEVLDGKPAAVVPLDELVQRLSPGHTHKLTKQDARFLASLLGKIGVGVEPDVRFGAATPKPGTSAVLFPLPPGAAGTPSDAYMAAMPLVHLAAVVAGADGNISADQRRFVVDHLEEVHGLDTAERRRVWSHLEFLTTGRLGMYGVKHKVAMFPPKSRADVGRFLVSMATADGAVSPAEVTALEKVFGYLGLDESDVYRWLHGLDNGDPGPVAVRTARPAARWRVADPDPAAVHHSVALDPAKIQARLADTARVSALLTDIFIDDDAPSEPDAPSTGPETESMIKGLDGPHSQLVMTLVSRPEWDRGAVEELVESVDLPFVDTALDVIDEAAIQLCGEPLFECHNPVVLNTYAAKEMT